AIGTWPRTRTGWPCGRRTRPGWRPGGRPWRSITWPRPPGTCGRRPRGNAAGGGNTSAGGWTTAWPSWRASGWTWRATCSSWPAGDHYSRQLYDTATGALQWRGPARRMQVMLYSNDGRHLFLVDESDAVAEWDVATHAVTRHFKGHDGLIRCAALSPDGRELL